MKQPDTPKASWLSPLQPASTLPAAPAAAPAVAPPARRIARMQPRQIDMDAPLRRQLVQTFQADYGGPLSAQDAAAVADVFLRKWAGQHLYVKVETDPDELLAERDAQMRRLAAAGLSLRKLARRFRVSKSQAHRIVAAGAVAGCPASFQDLGQQSE